MQSVLYMWCGYVLSWKKYYFILDENSIMYCANKGTPIQGTISLQFINIHVPVDNPVCFNIHTGVDIIYLKALSIQDKVRWVKKLNSIIKIRQKSGFGKFKQQFAFKSRKDQILKRFQQFVRQLWISHAKLQSSIENLSQKQLKINSTKTNVSILDEVRRSASSFKFKATQISKYCEQISRFLKSDNTKLKSNNFIQQQDQLNQNDETQFLSFSNDLTPIKYSSTVNKQLKRHIVHYNKEQSGLKKPFTYKENDGFQDMSQYEITPVKDFYNTDNQIKKNLFENNEVFKMIYAKLTNKKDRDSLPQKFTNQTKFPVLSTITSALGQNLTQVSFPVTINEPLSMLQRGCEQLYYSQLLAKAENSNDPIQKMTYIAGFVVSMYSLNEGRLKKPFNPLLGETFVYDDKEREFFYFSEQVSHHPPVSAMYCRSQNFQYVANSTSDLTFTGKSLKLVPSTKSYIKLNGQGEKYWFNKCTVSINNILFGNVYIQVAGEVLITCQNSKIKTKLIFNQKSWTKAQFQVQGTIYKQDRQELKLSGFWNKQLIARQSSGKQRIIWQKTHTQLSLYYNFNLYTLLMNHLPLSLIKQLPPTDSRFRPDQLILQYRDIQLSSKQKLRLQQKQRKRRKQNKQMGREHQIVWFKKVNIDGEEAYQFLNDKYQNQRFTDDHWKDSIDIYGD